MVPMVLQCCARLHPLSVEWEPEQRNWALAQMGASLFDDATGVRHAPPS